MKRIRSSNLLWAFLAVLIVGLYTVDMQTNKASMFSLPDFTTAEKAEEPPSKTIGELNDAIVEIADQAKSTVVTVNVTQTVEAPTNPFSRFFGQPDEQQEYYRQGNGSGVIVSEEGYILTNNHVVENADEIEITLYNDKQYDAEIIGTDPQTDIAVLKIDATDLNVIKLGNSDNIRVGEMVLAIGSPLGENLAHSVSMGIISAKERRIGILERNAGYENFLQTDAAINPGNSGGALVNMDGELVGINTAIASRSGGSDGIGFAIPIELAKKIMKSLIETGEVVRGYVGIQLGGEVDRTMARALDLEAQHGIIVGKVTADSPAEKAGLKEGDVIHSYNGKPLRNWSQFRTDVGMSSPGTEFELGVNRDGEELQLKVTLGELPQEMAVNQRPDNERSLDKQLGFKAQELTPQIAQQLNLEPSQNGIVVTEVTRGSNAQKQGLRRGDVIIEVDRKPIEGLRDFRSAIQDIAEGDDDVVLVRVLRNDNKQYIAFELN